MTLCEDFTARRPGACATSASRVSCLVLLLAVAAACGSNGSDMPMPTEADAQPEASRDGGSQDAATFSDAAPDVDEEAGTNGSGDVPVDSGTGECADATFDHDDDPSTECKPLSVCEPGQYVVSEGTSSADRGCASCPEGTFSTVNNAPSCTAWSDCPAGQRVTMEPDATTDRGCAPCDSGSFTVGENQSACSAWQDCQAGTRVTNTPSSSMDRVCESCPEGTDTTGSNQNECLPPDVCAAGSVFVQAATESTPLVCDPCEAGEYCAGGDAPLTVCDGDTWDDDADPATACVERTQCGAGQAPSAGGSATSDRTCEACSPGEYCAGGSASPVACGGATVDDDSDPSTECVSRTVCGAGQYVLSHGDASTDRSCDECAEGTFSAGSNAAECASFTECLVIAKAGTPSSDASCAELSVLQVESATHVELDGDFFYIVHDSGTGSSAYEVKYAKFDLAGDQLWYRYFGTEFNDNPRDLAVDGNGDLLVGGMTQGDFFQDLEDFHRGDGFVSKLADDDGAEEWTDQVASGGNEQDLFVAVTTDASNNVYAVGYTTGILPGKTAVGGADAVLRKYGANGAALWTRQFGTDDSDSANDVAVAANGSVYVVGHTYGTLPDETAVGEGDAYLAKFDASGTLLWQRQFGTDAYDGARAVHVGADGTVYVGGSTGGALPGHEPTGVLDGTVHAFTPAGTQLWDHQFGRQDARVTIETVLADGAGNLYLAGAIRTPDRFDDLHADAFVHKVDPSGSPTWLRSFGSSASYADESVTDLQLDTDGNLQAAGVAERRLALQTYLESGAFVVTMLP